MMILDSGLLFWATLYMTDPQTIAISVRYDK